MELEGGLIAARAVSYAALLLVAGVPAYLVIAGGARAATLRLRGMLSGLAVIAGAGVIWQMLASVAAMAGLTLSELDGATLAAVLDATPLGTVLEVRMLALMLVLVAMWVLPQGVRLPVSAVFGCIALASGVWLGHAGASEALLHRIADAVHLLASAVWLGALAVLFASLFSRDRPEQITRNLFGFARTGTVIVIVLVATGIANTVFITGWPIPPEALQSDWALTLGIKLALFAAMLVLAALNRWRFTPALARNPGPAAIRALRWSLGLEAVAGIAVVLAVAVLGTLSPLG